MNTLQLTDAEYTEIREQVRRLWGIDTERATVIPAKPTSNHILLVTESRPPVELKIDTPITPGIRGAYNKEHNILVIQRVT